MIMTNRTDMQVNPTPSNLNTRKKAFSRRDFLKASSATLGMITLAGCGANTSSSETPAGSSAGDAAVLRVGMEAAYAPYNWQTDAETEFTLPIDGLPGAFADGYDVQIAKLVAEGLGREAVAVKLAWDGLIDAVTNGSIDVIIAGMTATPDREESIDFTEPYLTETYGLLVRKDSEFAGATTLADFSGATVIGQKDTIFDEIIEDIPGVNHGTPTPDVPSAIAAVAKGTADACTYPVANTEGFLRSNPDLMQVAFAEGEGFQEEESCNIGLAKGQEDLLAQMNEILSGISQEQRDEIWSAACDRQPA